MGAPCQLVIVENGDGLGMWGALGPNEHRIASASGVVNYINTGLAYVRKHAKPDDWFVKFDADDYYSAIRATKIHQSAAQLLGATSLYCRTDDGRLLLASFGVDPGQVCPTDRAAHGGTLAARVGIACDFPETDRGWGEDVLWVDAMRSRAPMIELSPNGYCWMRHGPERGHAFPVHGADIRHLWSTDDVWDCGQWDPAVVDGEKIPEATLVPLDRTIQRRLTAKLIRRHNMATKTIKSDATINVNIGSGQTQFRLCHLVAAMVAGHPKFNADGPGIRSSVKVLEAAEADPEQGSITLELADLARLKEAMAATGQLPIRPGSLEDRRALADMIEAITEA